MLTSGKVGDRPDTVDWLIVSLNEAADEIEERNRRGDACVRSQLDKKIKTKYSCMTPIRSRGPPSLTVT